MIFSLKQFHKFRFVDAKERGQTFKPHFEFVNLIGKIADNLLIAGKSAELGTLFALDTTIKKYWPQKSLKQNAFAIKKYRITFSNKLLTMANFENSRMFGWSIISSQFVVQNVNIQICKRYACSEQKNNLKESENLFFNFRICIRELSVSN